MEKLIHRPAAGAGLPAPRELVDCSIIETLAALSTLEVITAKRRLMGIGRFEDDRGAGPVPLFRLGKRLDDGATAAQGD